MSDLEQKKKFKKILMAHPIWPLSAVMVPQRKLYLSNRIFPFSTKSLDKFLREVRKSTEKIQLLEDPELFFEKPPCTFLALIVRTLHAKNLENPYQLLTNQLPE